jgi:hypothetical protein
VWRSVFFSWLLLFMCSAPLAFYSSVITLVYSASGLLHFRNNPGVFCLRVIA